jgi:hypothetical protein
MTTAFSTNTPEKLFDALTTTADTKSSAYGIPGRAFARGRLVTWQSILNGVPAAISLQLQGAMNDVEAEYAVLDTSTATAGEMRHVGPLNLRFLRVRQVSRTGATDLTVTVMLA